MESHDSLEGEAPNCQNAARYAERVHDVEYSKAVPIVNLKAGSEGSTRYVVMKGP